MKLYNTRTRAVDEVKPLDGPNIKVYTCGPTVYDYSHIGHWFTYVRADLLIRSLEANGFKPKWVMNITDVGHLVSDADDGEDKLEKGARRESKTAWEIAEFYTKDFLDGLKQLNITNPDIIAKATDHISEQIDLIRLLEQKDYTYQIDDGIYFDTSKFSRYADFAKLELAEQQAADRMVSNPQKKNPADFAVWKLSPPDSKRDMEWDSPWGQGFPGWHIECSAMSMKYLGQTLDIHTGGIDHIPVHHTNEIAQSEAATGQTFANYWVHMNHVLVNGEKISKSSGNGVTLQQITGKGIPPEALRLHILESHYRSQSRFSWESLEAAHTRLKELHSLAVLRYQALPAVNDAATFAMQDVTSQLSDMLADDLNTPQAIALLSRLSNQLLAVLIERDMLSEFEAMLGDIDRLLGLRLMNVPDISQPQKDLVKQRETARAARDWTKSDEIRDRLIKDGIGLRDTPQGIIWFWL